MKILQNNILVIMLISAMHFSCTNEKTDNSYNQQKIDILNDSWQGRAIAYSGYRNGQHPDKDIFPTQKQISEDLKILEKNWKIIRTYGADQHGSDVLEVIERENIDLKVLLGIWMFGEPENTEKNKDQIRKGIELANKYKEIVIAINVGNECQVHWSDHKVPNEKLISYIKEVQSKVDVPVTTADTWDYWIDLELSAKLIETVDFAAVHIYPLWGKVDIDRAMKVTTDTFKDLLDTIPNKKIIITEAGWATYTEGDSHVPKAGDEIKQKKYFNDLMKWSEENQVIVFWFEAFDEPWKGTGTEGHWGLFSEGRKAKLAMHELYPNLITSESTSPGYD